MDISFCVWAPWVFSALAGLAGWLLRWWYDDQKIEALKSTIKTREDDIYHLNEAHTLLQNDKAKRLEEHKIESDSKNREILELRESLEQTEASTKRLLSQVVEKTKNESSDLSTRPLPSASIDHQIEDEVEEIAVTIKKSKNPSKKSKKRIRKYKKIIRQLKEENSGLLAQANEGQALVQEVVKEIPTTILKTIKISERVDRKKLKELINNLPLIKSKRTVRKKKKKGKVKIIAEK